MRLTLTGAVGALLGVLAAVAVTAVPAAATVDPAPTAALRDAVTAPFGFAIDPRETTGDRAELLLAHADQFTPENHMKPDGWYAWDRTFRMSDGTRTLMDFAVAHGVKVHGHTLVWHQQVPAWFFQDESGAPLAADAAGQEVLRERLRAHIDGVAAALSAQHGLFGGGNPVVSFDVVNEVIADSGEHADGLRRSEWYRILGEDYIDLAFEYADQAFNHTYAAPGAQSPVALVINDYGTEWPAKGARLHALVTRLLDRGVPVDGVGHQFHVGLDLPIAALSNALDRFEDLPVRQAVTEFDVPTGLPVTEEGLARQADYVEAAVLAFEERPEPLLAFTVWGLTDDRSWRNTNEGAPVLFDAQGQPKPAALAIMALAPPPAPELTLTDIAGNPFESEIDWLAATGVTTGWATEPGFAEFRPLRNVNRDQMAAFLYRMSGSPDFEDPAVPTFADVPAGHVFYTEIEWLATQGITNGWDVDGVKYFRPTTAVNRDVMAAFLYRYAGSPDFEGTSQTFVDLPTTHVFYDEVEWLATTGITNGWTVEAGLEFRPTAPVKRDVTAAFLARYADLPV